MNCPENTANIPNNDPLNCDGDLFYDTCIMHAGAYPFLSLPANSTQEQVNNAIVTTLINYGSRLNNSGFMKENLEIDGTYVLSADDNKKYYNVNSISNTPRIALNASLPDGFECYFLNNTPSLESQSLDDVLAIETDYTTPPLFTVPRQVSVFAEIENIVKNYGEIHVKKQSSNLYTVNGDLYNFPS